MAESQVPKRTTVALVCSRLEDFFARNSPWHRRLWNVGTVLGLREVAEYADACLKDEVNNTEGLRFVVETARREIGRDQGVGHLADELGYCLSELNKKATRDVPQQALDELLHLTRRADIEYCERWFDAPTEQPVEFMARALASHLLDGGLSSEHLHRWLKKQRASFNSLRDLAEATADMATDMQPRPFDVFIPCAVPYTDTSMPSGQLVWEGRAGRRGMAPRIRSNRENGPPQRRPCCPSQTARPMGCGRMPPVRSSPALMRVPRLSARRNDSTCICTFGQQR